MSAADRLGPDQRSLLDSWLPGWRIERDHSWGLVGTWVLEVMWAGERYAVKAADESDHHLGREITAHERWLGPWRRTGRGPAVVHHDRDARLLVTRWVPGTLVLGEPAEQLPDTYAQAGAVLRLLHDAPGALDADYWPAAQRKALAWLDRLHRIAPDVAARARSVVASWDLPPAAVVPTHGDWQPRNWVVDEEGVVRAIDLGRADLRPALTDLARLAAQQFRGRPDLEAAFVAGYGDDPRAADPGAWRRTVLGEAIGTAVWAYQVGDEDFEAQGHRMLGEALTPGDGGSRV